MDEQDDITDETYELPVGKISFYYQKTIILNVTYTFMKHILISLKNHVICDIKCNNLIVCELLIHDLHLTFEF